MRRREERRWRWTSWTPDANVDTVPDALVAEIGRLENEWTTALVDGDAERVRSFMTADFSITTAGWLDTPADAARWLDHAFDRFRLDRFAYDDLRLRRYGDVVVAQVRCHQRGSDLSSGAPWAMVFRYTDVWLLTPDGWRIDVRQATGRPWNEPEAAS